MKSVPRCRDCLYNLCMMLVCGSICVLCIMRFCDDDTDIDISLDSVGVHLGIYIDDSLGTLDMIYALTLGYCIVLYALTTQSELLRVNEKLESGQRGKLYSVAHGVLIQHSVYILLVGSGGYFYFSQNPNVDTVLETNMILNLNQLTSHGILDIAIMVVIGIGLFLFFPTVLGPARHSLTVLLLGEGETPNITQHILLTFCVDICSMIGAILIKDLSSLFAYSGAMFATILCLLLPPLLFWNIVVFPNKRFEDALYDQSLVSRGQAVSAEYSNSRYNLNSLHSKSTLNSIIATATPPLMNYARTVNVQSAGKLNEDKSSMLSGSMVSGNLKKMGSNSSGCSGSSNGGSGGALPNLMTPDAFNQVIAESYSRLYGSAEVNNSEKHPMAALMDSVEPEDGEKEQVCASSNSMGITPPSPSGKEMDSEYVSLLSHTQTDTLHLGDVYEEEEVNNGQLSKRGNGTTKSERSTPRTRSLRRESALVHERIEKKLNEAKIDRIRTLQNVHKSWTFWCDRIGAILLFTAGIILFLVGNGCNIMHSVDLYRKR